MCGGGWEVKRRHAGQAQSLTWAPVTWPDGWKAQSGRSRGNGVGGAVMKACYREVSQE